MAEYTAEVTSVHDGDTFTARIEVWPHPRVVIETACRVFGTDAPELRTPPGPAARDYLVGLLRLGQVLVQPPEVKDKYGRMLCRVAVVKPGGTRVDVAREMVAAGHAVDYFGAAKTLNQVTGLPVGEVPHG